MSSTKKESKLRYSKLAQMLGDGTQSLYIDDETSHKYVVFEHIRAVKEKDVNPERIQNKKNKILSFYEWTQRELIASNTICYIKDVNLGKGLGTGFLIAPNLVMTNYHVIDQQHKANDASGIRLMFDYAEHLTGQNKNGPTDKDVALAKDWLPYHSLEDELDYAILVVEREVGNESVPTSKGDITRGWLAPSAITRLYKETPLIILHHPEEEPLSFSISEKSVFGYNESMTRIYHSTNTSHGSSGSPCFTNEWELVALHHAAKRKEADEDEHNVAIPMIAISRDLSRKGLFLPEKPGNTFIVQPRSQYMVVTGIDEQLEYYARACYPKGNAFIDRTDFRKHLTNTVKGDPQFLAVCGEKKSGKSFSKHLISHVMSNAPKEHAFELIIIEPTSDEEEPVVEGMARSLTEQLAEADFEWSKPTEKATRWIPRFAEKVCARLKRRLRVLIIFDELNDPMIDEPCEHLVTEISKKVNQKVPNARVVYLGCRTELLERLSNSEVVVPQDMTQKITKDHIVEFILNFYRERGLVCDAATAGAEFNQIMQDLGPNLELRTVSMRLREYRLNLEKKNANSN